MRVKLAYSHTRATFDNLRLPSFEQVRDNLQDLQILLTSRYAHPADTLCVDCS